MISISWYLRFLKGQLGAGGEASSTGYLELLGFLDQQPDDQEAAGGGLVVRQLPGPAAHGQLPGLQASAMWLFLSVGSPFLQVSLEQEPPLRGVSFVSPLRVKSIQCWCTSHARSQPRSREVNPRSYGSIPICRVTALSQIFG